MLESKAGGGAGLQGRREALKEKAVQWVDDEGCASAAPRPRLLRLRRSGGEVAAGVYFIDIFTARSAAGR
eukprot:SAG31_NODE_1841_length_7117_cov_12.976207_7_plen_70_part_00